MAHRVPHLAATLFSVTALGLVFGAASCPSGGTLKYPPTVEPDTTLGPGDVIVVDVFNEDALANKPFQIASDGTIDYPLIDRVKVGGMKPEQVAELIGDQLIDGGFLLNPQVSVFVKGPGAGREAALRALIGSGFKITIISDVTPVPHNGCRPPKRRRV